jgi:hypothetical protein
VIRKALATTTKTILAAIYIAIVSISVAQSVVAEQLTNKSELVIIASLANPQGSDRDGEWLRLFNDSDTPLNLQDFTIKIDDKNTEQLSEEIVIVAAGKDIYLASNTEELLKQKQLNEELVSNLPVNLVNSGAQITLTDTNSDKSSTYDYEEAESGIVYYWDFSCDQYNYIEETAYDYDQLTQHIDSYSCKKEKQEEQPKENKSEEKSSVDKMEDQKQKAIAEQNQVYDQISSKLASNTPGFYKAGNSAAQEDSRLADQTYKPHGRGIGDLPLIPVRLLSWGQIIALLYSSLALTYLLVKSREILLVRINHLLKSHFAKKILRWQS